MPDDELSIRIKTPGSRRAKRDLSGVADAQGKVTKEAGDAARQSERANRGLRGLAGAARSLVAALGVGTGIAGAVSLIRKGIEAWRQDMEAIARLSREAGQNMIAFATMQEPGTVGKRARAAAEAGAEFGVAPGPAWSAVQALQSQTGSYEQGLAAAREAWSLSRLGVHPRAAQGAVSVGMGLGLEAPEAARAPFVAGQLSSLSPAEMAAAAQRGLPAYRGLGGGPLFGYQAMAVLSQVIKEPGRLGTYTARLASALSAEEGEAGAVWGRLGIERPGADPMAQLRALAGAGITSEQQLRRAGFAEEREVRALSIVLSNLGALERFGPQFNQRMARTGLLGEQAARLQGESPEIAHALAVERLAAEFQGAGLYGPNAGDARRTEMIERMRAVGLRRRGAWIGDDERISGWELNYPWNLPWDVTGAEAEMLHQPELLLDPTIFGPSGAYARLSPAEREAAAERLYGAGAIETFRRNYPLVGRQGGTTIVNQGTMFMDPSADRAAEVERHPAEE